MKPYYFLLVILVVSCSSGGNDREIKPAIQDITESVYASAQVVPIVHYKEQPTRSGTIKEIFVEEGDEVKEGQLLYKIETPANVHDRFTNAQLNLKEAKSDYEGDDNLLTNIELEIQQIGRKLVLDSINLARLQRLWNQSVGKKVDLDRASLEYQSTQIQYKIAQKKYAQAISNLKNKYKKARSGFSAEQNELGEYQVRSKMDGLVYHVNKKVGDYISTQEVFAEIGSRDNFLVEMDIDEVDIASIQLGDSVAIVLDAYPNEVFLANVSKIAPKKDEATQTFRVECLFNEKPTKLYYGLSGEANIIVDKRDNALTIPTEYLTGGNKVLTPDGEREVVLGVKNLKQVEILSGIDSTTLLIKPGE